MPSGASEGAAQRTAPPSTKVATRTRGVPPAAGVRTQRRAPVGAMLAPLTLRRAGPPAAIARTSRRVGRSEVSTGGRAGWYSVSAAGESRPRSVRHRRICTASVPAASASGARLQLTVAHEGGRLVAERPKAAGERTGRLEWRHGRRRRGCSLSDREQRRRDGGGQWAAWMGRRTKETVLGPQRPPSALTLTSAGPVARLTAAPCSAARAPIALGGHHRGWGRREVVAGAKAAEEHWRRLGCYGGGS